MGNSYSDHTLQLLIEFQAQLSAATKARDELLEMRRQATAMGVSTAGLDDEIGKLDKDIERLGKKDMPEASEGVKMFTAHGTEMKRLVSELNRVLPGFGVAFKAIFNPTNIGIAAAVFAVQQLVSAYQTAVEADQNFKAALAVGADVSSATTSIGNFSETIAAAAVASDNYSASIEKIKTAQKSLKDLTDDSLKALNDETQALARVAAAKLKAEMAQVAADAATGKISPAEKARRIAALEAENEADSQRRTQAQRAKEIALRENQLKQTAAAAAVAEASIPALEDENKRQRISKERKPLLIASLNEQIAAAKERIKELEKLTKPLEEADDGAIYPGAMSEEGRNYRKAKDTILSDQNLIANFKRQLADIQSPEKTVDLDLKANAAARKLSDAEAEAKRLREEEAGLKNQIEELKRQAALANTTDAAVRGYDEQARQTGVAAEAEQQRQRDFEGVKKSPTGKVVGGAIDAAGRVRRGQGDGDDAIAVQSIASLANKSPVNLETALRMMETAQQNQSAFANLVNRLADAALKLSPQDLALLQERVQQLEFQVQKMNNQ